MKNVLIALIVSAVIYFISFILLNIILGESEAVFIGIIIAIGTFILMYYRQNIKLIIDNDADNADLYAIAEKEVDGNQINSGFWSKALVKANGNEELRKVEYIKLRVAQLKKEK